MPSRLIERETIMLKLLIGAASIALMIFLIIKIPYVAIIVAILALVANAVDKIKKKNFCSNSLKIMKH